MDKKIKKTLENFLKIMNKNFSQEDLQILSCNIKTLKISAGDFKFENFLSPTSTTGAYSIKKNEIIIDMEEFSSTIYHELLHMSSSYYKNGMFYSGFNRFGILSQLKLINIGKGIDECYTELLNRRYFVKDKDITASYKYQIFITSKLEEIITKTRMESLYLNADLEGLIDDLEKYINREEIMNFIYDMDFIYKRLKENKILFIDKKTVEDTLNRINLFIVKVYLKKVYQQYLKNEISYEKLIKKSSNYIYSIGSRITIGKNNFQIFSQEDLKKCCDFAFENDSITFDYKEIVKKYK